MKSDLRTTCCAQRAASEGRYLPSIHSLPRAHGDPNAIHSVPVAPRLENWPGEWLIFAVSWGQYGPPDSPHGTEDQQNPQGPAPPGQSRAELQATLVRGEQSWGTHQLPAPRHVCERFSEPTFLLQQVLSKNTVRMKISKGEVPE